MLLLIAFKKYLSGELFEKDFSFIHHFFLNLICNTFNDFLQ